MKKLYIKPSMRIYVCHMHHLLAGSGGDRYYRDRDADPEDAM